MTSFTYIDSPLGRLLLAAEESALTGLWIEGQRYFASTLPENAIRNDGLKIFLDVRCRLDAYFAGGALGTLPALSPPGTAFRKTVWNELLKIPRGTTVTYGELAERIRQLSGRPTSPRAVAGAVAHNPISLLIPCHRVVAANGIGGYAGGTDRKLWLLNLERN